VADYQVLTTTMAGVPYAEIANASIESVTWELNGWGEMQFRLPVNDPQAWTELRPEYQTKREVQVWRNGRLIWWGVYVAASADDRTVTFTCFGLLWYFSRRYFGPVHSNSMPAIAVNGGMESTPVTTGWTASAGATVSAVTQPRYSGAQAMKIVTASAVGVENFVFQTISIPTPARGRPLRYLFRARLFVESVTTHHPHNFAMIIGPPFASAALATQLKPGDPNGVWRYIENEYEAPAGASGNLSIVLYAPSSGTVYWDAAEVTYNNFTGGIQGEDWSADYLRRIVRYGAGLDGGGGPGTEWWGAPIAKSSLGMTWAGTGGPAAGSLPADFLWDHADEANIYSAIAELAARDVLDYEITWPTDGRSRTFTTWAPSKGSTKLGMAIEAGKNLVSYRYDVDGRTRANDVRVAGRGAGSVRETAQAGGPIVTEEPQLEAILQPAFEISGQPLVELSLAEWGRRKDPVRVPTLTVAAGDFFETAAGGPLTVGDSIPVRIDNGWVQENATRRVGKMTLKPANETLDVVVNT
jgi:hypothetical protein